jgi:hypothetical protein
MIESYQRILLIDLNVSVDLARRMIVLVKQEISIKVC